MVTSASEVRRIRRKLGSRYNHIGITAETPAAALRIEELLEVAEFVEIGLNDMTQYTMAWDRDIPNEERLPSDRIVEPVADLVASVAKACAAGGVPYTLGIDLRPTESLAAQVISLGIESISCAPSLVKPWKHAIAALPEKGGKAVGGFERCDKM
jgi:phosphotransferase system enzyme I (PtsI)